MSLPLILLVILGFIWVIALFIPNKTKEGKKLKSPFGLLAGY
jgi:hypothetical protein